MVRYRSAVCGALLGGAELFQCALSADDSINTATLSLQETIKHQIHQTFVCAVFTDKQNKLCICNNISPTSFRFHH